MADFVFSDGSVEYEKLVRDIAISVARLIKEDCNDPPLISQRTAFAIFGRANVERWRRRGLINPIRSPGKLEYKTAELRFLQRKNEK